MNPTVKILLAYHKQSALLKNDIFLPIHVGRATQNDKDLWLTNNLIGDNTGENISNKNPNYCELTAQYWAWKNYDKLGNPDYIGFMHYRRHLNFNIKKNFSQSKWGTVHHNCLDNTYISKFGLNEENIKNVLSQYDIITAQAWDVTNAKSKNNFYHYATSDSKLHIKDYETAINVLIKKYPEYKESIEKYNSSTLGYYTNIFIMKKDIFHSYASWLFDILFALEKQTDVSNYNFQEARIYGYISEWLFGIWLTHNLSKYKVKELQRTFLDNTDCPEDINVCFASDNSYAKYMGIAISSILNNKNPSDNLNFYILDGGISKKNKSKIESLKKKHNFNITYIKMDDALFNNYPLRGSNHFTLATYYRLLLATLLPNIKKTIYLDCDIIVKSSLRNLYNLNIDNKYLLGVIDILHSENCQRLKLPKYVNAGVLLLNLQEWRNNKIEEKFKIFIQKYPHKIVWNDQDVLNTVLQEKLDYIDNKWNCQLTEYTGGLTEEFRNLRNLSHIIHFVSNKKPWIFAKCKYSQIYYNEVKKTPWKIDYIKYPIEKIAKFIFSKQKTKTYKIYTLFGIKIKKRRQKSFK